MHTIFEAIILDSGFFNSINTLNPKIISIAAKKVIGMHSETQHHNYADIVVLWQQFMPRKRELQHTVSEEVIAMQLFDLQEDGQPNITYKIWACTEVSNLDHIPDGFDSFVIPDGDYAVFVHKGMDASKTYQRIMTEWLPNSGYVIDNRPHFQVMGEKYRNGSPDSEEDFYVPIKKI